MIYHTSVRRLEVTTRPLILRGREEQFGIIDVVRKVDGSIEINVEAGFSLAGDPEDWSDGQDPGKSLCKSSARRKYSSYALGEIQSGKAGFEKGLLPRVNRALWKVSIAFQRTRLSPYRCRGLDIQRRVHVGSEGC